MPPRPDGGAKAPRLDPLLDTAPAGFLTLDERGTVHAANATLVRLLGYADRAELEGRHVDVILPIAGRIFYNTHLFPMLRVQGRAEELYVPLRHRDGSDIPMLVNGSRRKEGAEPRFDLVVVPMRQRNQLESELIAARNAAQQASAAKDRFLSIVSHELRSPLSGISGYAELLLRERRGPLTPDQRAYVERIRDASLYQASLIEDILDFAAIGERRELDPIVVPLEEILARADSILAVRAADEGRPFERRPKPATGSVRADGRAAQQILLNLGMNALKYGSSGSPVILSAVVAEDRVRISVADRGEGISAEAIERIFEPFVQLPGRRDEASRRGVGLGLAISRDLARAMNGDITVESELGRGSTFTLDLPAASAA